MDTNAISVDLTEDGAKAMLSLGRPRAGADGPTVSNAKGLVTFWVTDGELVKSQLVWSDLQIMEAGGNGRIVGLNPEPTKLRH